MLTDITILKVYHYLQYLDLSWNKLTNLTVLGQLPFLVYLDASHNQLEKLLDFKAPLNLTFANFSYNFISELGDLSDFYLLVHLDVSNNYLNRIHPSIEKLRFLHFLDLSSNSLDLIENLENLRTRELRLHSNPAYKFVTIHNKPQLYDYLTHINLNNNQLNSLHLFQGAYNLESLEIAENRIKSLIELYSLQTLRYLVKLNLQRNPIASLPNYQTACMLCCRHLFVLDDAEVNLKARVNIANRFKRASTDQSLLLLLKQLSFPEIGVDVFAFDENLALVLVLVGPPASGKGSLAQNFCKTNGKYCVFGVSHTTRPKTAMEQNGSEYYFVNSSKFREMTKSGDFLTVYEFNGYSYGLSHAELAKCDKKVLVLHMDIRSAITLRLSGLNPKLILTISRSEYEHLKMMQSKYALSCSGAIIKQQIPNPVDVGVMSEAQAIVRQVLRQVAKNKAFTFTKVINEFAEMVFDEEKPCWEIEACNSHSRRSSEEKKSGNSGNSGILKAIGKPLEKNHRTSVTFNNCGVNELCTCLKCPDIREKLPKEIYLRSAVNELAFEAELRETKAVLAVMFNEKLALFYESVLEIRKEMLEVHWSNPGLFATVLFTNSNENSAQLQRIVKELITNCKYSTRQIEINEEFINKRRELLHSHIFNK